MRDKDRIEPFVETLKELWLKHPNLRFRQLMYILENKIKSEENISDIFYIEDDKYLEHIKKFIEKGL